MNKLISILIATYNGQRSISRCLEAVINQKNIDFSLLEVVVVDNNSNDETPIIVNSFLNAKLPFQLKYFIEKQQGSTYARRTGLKKCSGDYILMCDDDVVLQDKFLFDLFNLIQENQDSTVVAFASLGYLENYNLYKDFIVENITNVGALALTGYLDFKEGVQDNYFTFHFAGLTVRKDVLIQIDSITSDIALAGKVSNSIAAGEDTEICCWIGILGFRVFLSHKLKFYHLLDPNRLNNKALKKQIEAYSKFNLNLAAYEYFIARKRLTLISAIHELLYVLKNDILLSLKKSNFKRIKFKLHVLVNYRKINQFCEAVKSKVNNI